MSSKHVAARQQIRRWLDRRNDKEAYKQAKGLYRLDASPETRELLERAYLLRIESLVEGEMIQTAKETAEAWLNLGVTVAELLPPLLKLLTRVGLGARALELSGQGDANGADAARVATTLCDEAVRRPELAGGLTEEQVRGAQQVREALAAVLAGNESRATELLAGIPRQSSFAEWKLFARGLAAWQRGDAAAADENWQRLSDARPPAAIARSLRRERQAASGEGGAAVEALERRTFGEPITPHLLALERALTAKDLQTSLRALKLADGALRRAGLEDLRPRLTASVLEPFVFDMALGADRRQGERAIGEFTRTAAPLPFDPGWHRLWALVWECAGSPDLSIDYWKQYVRSLAGASFDSPEQRRLFEAIGWELLGERQFALLEEEELANEFQEFEEDYFASERRRAAAAKETCASFERCVQLRPDFQSARNMLVELCVDYADALPAGKSAKVARETLAADPTDANLVASCFRVGVQVRDGDLQLRAVQRWRALKPLDSEHDARELWARLTLARTAFREKRFDVMRSELKAAEPLARSGESRANWRAAAAVLAFAARDDEAANACLVSDDDPDGEVALWYAVLDEARETPLGALRRGMCQLRFQEVLRPKASRAKAVAFARVSEQRRRFGFSQDEELQEQLARYLKRTSKEKFDEDELAPILQTLGELPTRLYDAAVHVAIAKSAAKRFPQSAFCRYQHAMALVARETSKERGSPRAALRELDAAGKLASRPGDPHADLLPEIEAGRQMVVETFRLLHDSRNAARSPSAEFED